MSMAARTANGAMVVRDDARRCDTMRCDATTKAAGGRAKAGDFTQRGFRGEPELAVFVTPESSYKYIHEPNLRVVETMVKARELKRNSRTTNRKDGGVQ